MQSSSEQLLYILNLIWQLQRPIMSNKASNYNYFRFVRAFRERVSPEQRPIVVHCSAGVGRSGTMIAIDRILQGIRKYDVVDIFGIVYEMRKERVWMVQTEQQYICIHQVRGRFL